MALIVPQIELGPLLPHFSEFIAAIVFALALTVVIGKKVVPAFEKTYAERAEAIQGGMEKAEHAQAEAEAALADYKAQLAEARSEAAKIREDAKNQGAQIMAEMREQANHESNRILAGARTQLEAERTQVMGQMRGEIGGLATTLAGRIVGETLDDDERARRTVERFLTDLEAKSDDGDRHSESGQDGSEHDDAGDAGADPVGSQSGQL